MAGINRTTGKATDLITFSRASGGTALRKISYGSELVTNGTFDADSDWGKVNATISGGVASLSGNSLINQTVATGTLQGKLVVCTFSITSYTSGALKVGTSSGAQYIQNVSGVGEYSFTAIFDRDNITFQRQSVDFTGDIDNVSVKEVLFDQPDGTLTLFNHPTNIPRIEYDAAGNVKGLLIEEARTNLVTYSDLSANINPAGATLTDNIAFGIDGETSAATLVEDTSTGVHRFTQTSAPTITSGIAYSASIYAKANGRTEIRLTENATTGAYATFNLLDGSIVSSGLGGSGVTEDIGNGWYRCTMTFTSAGTVGRIDVLLSSSGSVSYTGDGVSGVYLYGEQLEAGSFPTSYIPTSGATATRAADIASISVDNFGYNQKAYTIAFEMALIGRDSTDFPRVIAFGNQTGNLGFYCTSSNIYYDKSGTGSLMNRGISIGAVEKFAATAGIGGGEFHEEIPHGFTSTTTEVDRNISTVWFGSGGGVNNFLNGHIKSIAYYPRRLSNAQLQALTA